MPGTELTPSEGTSSLMRSLNIGESNAGDPMQRILLGISLPSPLKDKEDENSGPMAGKKEKGNADQEQLSVNNIQTIAMEGESSAQPLDLPDPTGTEAEIGLNKMDTEEENDSTLHPPSEDVTNEIIEEYEFKMSICNGYSV